MNFNTHSTIEGKHAFLSPSSYHWINYNDQKLDARWHAANAARLGVELHEFSHMAIRLGIKQAKNKTTISMYVNDGIAYKMSCEQPLFYSDNCFGTPDTICFRNNLLRIHDLKTGVIPASHHQLEVYAALFCLEYGYSPFDIGIELRIYQRGDIDVYIPYPDVILKIMDTIVMFDQRIELLREGVIGAD